jgi:hypothetical protein
LIPEFDGAVSSLDGKKAFWTDTPREQHDNACSQSGNTGRPTLTCGPGLNRTWFMAKRWLREGLNTRLDSALELAAAYWGACHQTENHAQAVNVLLEKRQPVFTGT